MKSKTLKRILQNTCMHLGLVIPSSNTVMEKELSEYVTVHSTRIPLTTVDELSLKKMNKELVKAVTLITDSNPDVIVYGCTSGSFVEAVEMVTTIPAVTASQAVVSALKTLKAKTVSVATPYTDEINQKEKAFLKSHGISMVDMKGLNLLTNTDIGKQPPEVVYNLAKSLKRADVIFISCTNFQTFAILRELEEDLNIPVVSSNSAVLWRALQLGKEDTKPLLGRLLEEYL